MAWPWREANSRVATPSVSSIQQLHGHPLSEIAGRPVLILTDWSISRCGEVDAGNGRPTPRRLSASRDSRTGQLECHLR